MDEDLYVDTNGDGHFDATSSSGVGMRRRGKDGMEGMGSGAV